MAGSIFLTTSWRLTDLTSLAVDAWPVTSRTMCTHTRMSSMDVSRNLVSDRDCMEQTESSTNDSRPFSLIPPPLFYLPSVLCGDNDVLVYRFSFHKRPLSALLHPSSFSVVVRKNGLETCWRRRRQSMLCEPVETRAERRMPAGCQRTQHDVEWRSGLRAVIDKTVHSWRVASRRDARHACASRYVRPSAADATDAQLLRTYDVPSTPAAWFVVLCCLHPSGATTTHSLSHPPGWLTDWRTYWGISAMYERTNEALD